MEEVWGYIEDHEQEFVRKFRQFIQSPSISTSNIGMDKTAEFLSSFLQDKGIKSRKITTEGYPVVFGDIESPKSERVLLVYSHYDVQPPGKREEWIVDPFSAKIRHGKIYGRGTVDAKGSLFGFLQAIEAFLEVKGELPLNLKLVFDGEEEIGSPNLDSFVVNHEHMLKADATLFVDAATFAEGRQIVSLGNKGMLFVEIKIEAPNPEIHSMYAPIVRNPAWRLIDVLRSLKKGGKVLIEGFYDNVNKVGVKERAKLELAKDLITNGHLDIGGIEVVSGVPPEKLLERWVYEPTCNINGMASGFLPEGKKKTIVPTEAHVKIDFRLVPDQHPDEIYHKLVKHLNQQGFKDVEIGKSKGSFLPFETSLEEEIAQATIAASEDIFEAKPIVMPMIPASAPVYVFPHRLGTPAVHTGVGYFELCHSPNEFITTSQYINGIKLFAAIMQRYSEK